MKGKPTDREMREQREQQLERVIINRIAFYRENPHRFVEEYLGIQLKTFQKILIYMMEHTDYFYYVASRGQGKTFLVALYACVRCILYPHTKCITVSYTLKQGMEIIAKIQQDFMPNSVMLRKEIKKITTSNTGARVEFWNGSFIEANVAGESLRGKRSNLLIVDESRMIPQKTLDTIVRPLSAGPRHPGYLDKPEYAHLQEMNKEFYMSSAWYKQSEMYEKVKTFLANSLDPSKSYFVCALPYQLSIMEGLLMRQTIVNMMSEETFSDISFMMEYCAEFYGATDDSLFNYDDLVARRMLIDGMRPLDFYRETNTPVPPKEKGEVRILSLDVALLASRRHDNDASCFMLNQCQMATATPVSNFTFVDTREGLLTEELGLMAMRYFYQYDCDYFVIDANGIGQGTLDYIMSDRYDPMYGRTYKAMTVVNNEDLAIRCKVRDATKCVYAIKATAKQNSDMALGLRSGFQNGYINLLINETDIEDKWTSRIKGWTKLQDGIKTQLRLPYYQTTAMIDEMVNLQHDIVGGNIRVKERAGMRKDRYSSAIYNYYVVQELSRKRKVKSSDDDEKLLKMFKIRRGVVPTTFGGNTYRR